MSKVEGARNAAKGTTIPRGRKPKAKRPPIDFSRWSISEITQLLKSEDPHTRTQVERYLKRIFNEMPKTGDGKRLYNKNIKNSRLRNIVRANKIETGQTEHKGIGMLNYLRSVVSARPLSKEMLEKINKKKLPKDFKLMDMSGSEPKFRKWLWGAEAKFIENQNCYAYGMNQFRFHREMKSIPGLKRGAIKDDNYITCDVLVPNIHGDAGSRAIKLTDASKRCPKGTYKMMLFVTDPSVPDEYKDFHFYRQDADGTWSHKQGTLYAPSKLDANGDIIFDPRKSDRNFHPYNYSKFCKAFCIPKEIKVNI